MFPNKLESILLVLALVAVQFAFLVYLNEKGVTWKAGEPAIYIVCSILSVFVITWFSLGKMRLRFGELFHSNQDSVSKVIIITIVPIIMVVVGLDLLLSNYLNLYGTYFPKETARTENINQIMDNGLLGFISICVVAPVIEEIVFRGIILRGLLGNYSKFSALFFSSMLFGFAHFNPDQLVHAFMGGLFLGWLYMTTFSLWPSIIAHSLFNTFAYILSTSIIQIDGVNHFPNGEIIYLSLAGQLIAIVLLYFGFITLKRSFDKR